MKYRIGIYFCFLLALCFAAQANAQRVTRLAPPNITYRAVCMADNAHSMFVGDSAVVLYNDSAADSTTFIDRNTYSYIAWGSHFLNSPCNSSHTLYGVSYYDPFRAVVIADGGLIFTTSDTGAHWAPSAVGMTTQTLRGITHTADGGLVVVGDGGIILRSADSGASWKTIASSTTRNINGISINASGRGYFVGEHGLIGMTTDYGVTWPAATVTDTSAFGFRATTPVTLRGVAMSNADSAVAVGDSGAVGMTLDGTNWIDMGKQPGVKAEYSLDFIARTSFRAVIYTPFNGYGTWLIFSESDLFTAIGSDTLSITNSTLSGDLDGGSDTLIWRFEGASIWSGSTVFNPQFGGSNFANCIFSPYTPAGLSKVAISGQLEGFNFLFASFDSLGYGYATGTAGGYLKTTNNGLTWIVSLSGSNKIATDIHTIDSNNAFAVGFFGALYRTTDGGKTWVFSGIELANNRLHGIANPAPNVFVVCGDEGTILVSTDNANTWTESFLDTAYLQAIAFSTPDIGVAVGALGTIYRTVDQGVSWKPVNNPNSGSNTSYRQVVGFPKGTYFAATDATDGSVLFTSTNQGLNWEQTNQPAISMGFYNDSIGVVAESAWSSAIVNDTMQLAFTRDGFKTPPIEFTVPIISNDRIIFHFLDSTTFLCLGSDGFVVKVDMSQGSARVTDLSPPQTSPIQLFPNPSATHSTTINYDIANSGPTTIELWNILGEKVQTLFVGNEAIGHHSQQLKINPELHGSYFVKVISGTETMTIPISVEN